jgi:hypothetical protein
MAQHNIAAVLIVNGGTLDTYGSASARRPQPIVGSGLKGLIAA